MLKLPVSARDHCAVADDQLAHVAMELALVVYPYALVNLRY